MDTVLDDVITPSRCKQKDWQFQH